MRVIGGTCLRCQDLARLNSRLLCQLCNAAMVRATGLGTFPISSSTRTRIEDERREQEQMTQYLRRMTGGNDAATAETPCDLPRPPRPSHEEIERRRDTVLAKYNSRLPLYRPR